MCKTFVKPAETLPIVAGNKDMANDLLKSIMSKNCFNFGYSIVLHPSCRPLNHCKKKCKCV